MDGRLQYVENGIEFAMICHKEIDKLPALNKRFGTRRGVYPQKVLSDFQAFTPVRAFVVPRPSYSMIKTKYFLRNFSKKLTMQIFVYSRKAFAD
jgi:hypothetical protein